MALFVCGLAAAQTTSAADLIIILDVSAVTTVFFLDLVLGTL